MTFFDTASMTLVLTGVALASVCIAVMWLAANWRPTQTNKEE